MISPARARALRPLLEALDRGLDRTARIAADPVEFPRACADPADAEVAGLVAVALAYGRADLFKPVVARVLAAMGPSPARFAEGFAAAPDRAAFAGLVYRFNRPPDLAALVAAIGHLRRAHGGLGARFRALLPVELVTIFLSASAATRRTAASLSSTSASASAMTARSSVIFDSAIAADSRTFCDLPLSSVAI